MSAVRCIEIALTIPDNEARTALDTLRRLGVPVDRLERADLYRFALDGIDDERLVATVRGLETLFNPNKHALRVRPDAEPGPGELWVHEVHDDPRSSDGEVRIAGRPLPGVRRVERFVAWRMSDDGRAAGPEVVARAAETLLCNPAFQKATVSA